MLGLTGDDRAPPGLHEPDHDPVTDVDCVVALALAEDVDDLEFGVRYLGRLGACGCRDGLEKHQLAAK